MACRPVGASVRRCTRAFSSANFFQRDQAALNFGVVQGSPALHVLDTATERPATSREAGKQVASPSGAACGPALGSAALRLTRLGITGMGAAKRRSHKSMLQNAEFRIAYEFPKMPWCTGEEILKRIVRKERKSGGMFVCNSRFRESRFCANTGAFRLSRFWDQPLFQP